MEQMIASLLSAACMEIGFLVFTRSTLTPLDNIGVITMKMISITSITSTIGVTLMSAMAAGCACFGSSTLAIVSSRETGKSGELAFGPPNQLDGSQLSAVTGLGPVTSLERVDDADHRSEQTHEGRRRADGCQAGHAAL